MIKKLFSKRSGFTLIEIVVAFAIFAIMASMILQILNSIMYEKSNNRAIEEQLQAQEELIAKNGRTGVYNADKKEPDQIVFDFGANGKFGRDYMVMKPGDEDGLNYYLGAGSNEGNNPSSPVPTEPITTPSGAGSQLNRMDTRITGTSGFDSINVYKVIKDTSYSGPGVRYLFDVSASGKSVTNEMVPYAQYKLYFCMSDKYDIVESSSDEDDDSTYKKKVPQKAQIIDGGYINSGWDALGNMTWASINGDTAPFSSTSYGIGKDPNYYNVKILNNYTVRIGSPYVNDHANAGEIGSKKRGVRFLSSKHSRFYLVFAEDPKLTTESFGADFDGNAVKGDRGQVEYSRVPILDEDGDSTGEYNVNIYGAFEFEKADK